VKRVAALALLALVVAGLSLAPWRRVPLLLALRRYERATTSEERGAAMGALRELPRDEVLAELCIRCDDPSAERRWRAAWAIGALEERSALVPGRLSPAAWQEVALTFGGEEGSVPELPPGSYDLDWAAQMRSGPGLRLLLGDGGPEALGRLVRAAREGDPERRAAALEALALRPMSTPDVDAALCALAREERFYVPSLASRSLEAALAGADPRDAALLVACERALEQDVTSLAGARGLVRARVGGVLEVRTLTLLTNALATLPEPGHAALALAEAAPDPRWVEALVAAPDPENTDTVTPLAAALARLRDPAWGPLLAEVVARRLAIAPTQDMWDAEATTVLDHAFVAWLRVDPRAASGWLFDRALLDAQARADRLPGLLPASWGGPVEEVAPAAAERAAVFLDAWPWLPDDVRAWDAAAEPAAYDRMSRELAAFQSLGVLAIDLLLRRGDDAALVALSRFVARAGASDNYLGTHARCAALTLRRALPDDAPALVVRARAWLRERVDAPCEPACHGRCLDDAATLLLALIDEPDAPTRLAPLARRVALPSHDLAFRADGWTSGGPPETELLGIWALVRALERGVAVPEAREALARRVVNAREREACLAPALARDHVPGAREQAALLLRLAAIEGRNDWTTLLANRLVPGDPLLTPWPIERDSIGASWPSCVALEGELPITAWRVWVVDEVWKTDFLSHLSDIRSVARAVLTHDALAAALVRQGPPRPAPDVPPLPTPALPAGPRVRVEVVPDSAPAADVARALVLRLALDGLRVGATLDDPALTVRVCADGTIEVADMTFDALDPDARAEAAHAAVREALR
jgi:hypothetical protein